MPKIKAYDLRLFFSNRYTYAQIVRNIDGHIVASASTIEKALRDQLPNGADKAASARVGQLLAERAAAQQVPEVHWERKRGQKYHGKIASLLLAMKNGGLPLN